MENKKSTPQKRLFADLSSIEPSTAAVHCAIEVISPVKKAKSGVSYFDGMVTDGKRKVRIVGFNEGTQEKLSAFHTNKEAIKLDNCLIKKSRSDDLEILVNKTTSVTQSPRKFNVPLSTMDTIEEMSLNELERIEDGTKVTVKATIVSLAPVRAVSTGKVQDVIISDPSGTVNLSVWEDNVNKLEVGKTYKFSNVYVRSYQGVKSITLSRQSTYETIEGGNIITVDEIETEELQQAQIIGCQNFMIHVSCVNCSGKLLIDGNSSSARCSNCKILQLTKGRHFEVAANILVQSKDGEKNNLKICTENILKLIPDLEVSQSSRELEDKLLYAPKMNIIYTKKTHYFKNINIEKK